MQCVYARMGRASAADAVSKVHNKRQRAMASYIWLTSIVSTNGRAHIHVPIYAQQDAEAHRRAARTSRPPSQQPRPLAADVMLQTRATLNTGGFTPRLIKGHVQG